MAGGWITTGGGTGSVQVRKQGDECVLENPSADREVRCVFLGEFELSDDTTSQTIELVPVGRCDRRCEILYAPERVYESY